MYMSVCKNMSVVNTLLGLRDKLPRYIQMDIDMTIDESRPHSVDKYVEVFSHDGRHSVVMPSMGAEPSHGLKYGRPRESRKQVKAVSKTRHLKIVCSLCKGCNFDVTNDTTHICRNCGNQKDVFNISPSHKDSSRINMSVRYTYKRRIHFKDCINQYQGKQNANIDNKVYEDLYTQIRLHDINVDNDYSALSKEQLAMFIKDTGHTKHYEDINLIYRVITGKSVDDISYLEDILVHDFDVLTDMYDRMFKHTNRLDRKSFINTQYVLFQLLMRHKHPCDREDFNILKTTDRKSLHEDIISELFDTLGWNFTSLF